MFVFDSGAPMHLLRRISSDELDTLRRSRNPTTVVTANGEVQTKQEAQVYVHDETPAVLSLVSFAQNTDIQMSGKTVKHHVSHQMGKQLLVGSTTSYLLSYQDCHHLPAAARLLHRNQRVSQILSVNRKHHQIQ